MDSPLRSFSQLLNTTLLLAVILAGTAVGAALLLIFQAVRGAWQHFRARRFDALSLEIHGHWREIVRGEIPAKN